MPPGPAPSRCRLRPAALLLALLLGFAAPVAAQDLAVRELLPNGVTLLVAERPALPIVVLRAWIRAGAILDSPGKAGLANLTAELLTRGTRTRTGRQIDQAIEFVGGSLSSGGGRDGIVVSLSVLKKDLALGLDLVADVLLNPTFPQEEFERKVQEIRAAVQRAEESPETVASKAFRRLVFDPHPYGTPVEGTVESLGRLTRDDVVAFYTETYRPQETVVVAVGDVTRDEIRVALEQRFGGWPMRPRATASPAAAPLGGPAKTRTIQKDVSQASVLLGQAGIGRHHPDYYTLQVASYILGGGSASRLYHRLREERGLVYSVYSYLAPGRYGAVFELGFQTRNEGVREALEVVRQELTRLRQEWVSEEEVARAKAYLIGSFPLRMDTTGEVAGLLLTIEEHGLGLDYPSRFRGLIEAVSVQQIFQAVRIHWDPDAMILVVVGNLKQAGLPASE
ncbi:MAG: insulinase family protein [Candidatus Rokubacteria bacterium]|nr:insulinase family protein [Candidatus Rokubacteria bacterium]